MLALVGAGSLGQAYAGLLARSGQAVTLLSTEGTAALLLEAGVIRLRGAVTADVPVGRAPAAPGAVSLVTDPAAIPDGAGVIFTTKGHQTAAAADRVRAAWPHPGDTAGWVGGVQNGLAKDDILAERFGAARLVGAVSILGSERRANGEIAIAALGRTFLGEMDGGRSARAANAVAALVAAGVPAEEPADIRSVLWSKACNAAGVFGVSVLARVSAPRLFRDPDFIRAYLGLVRETAALGAAYGIPVGDYTNFPIRTYVTAPDEETVATLSRKNFLAPTAGGAGPRVESLPSMTQDLLAERGLEVDEVFGDLVARAEAARVDVPRLRLVRDILRGMDPGRPH